MNGYLIANNIFIRKLLGESFSAGDATITDDLKLAQIVQTSNDLFQNSGIRLSDVYLTEIDSHDTIRINSVLDHFGDNDVALVCRFNQYDCELCVTYAIERATAFVENNDMHLLIWGCYEDDNILKAVRGRYSLDISSSWYNVPELSIPMEKHGNPYYLVITKDGLLVDCFTPDKNNPKMTDRYFSMVDSKWKTNNCKWY